MKISYKDKFAYIFKQGEETNIIRIPDYLASLLKLAEGNFKVEEVRANEKGLWISREGEDGDDMAIVHGPDSTAQFIKSFCWKEFSDTTGIDLEPGESGKYRLTKVKESAIL